MDGWIGLSGCGKWMDVESGCGKWKVEGKWMWKVDVESGKWRGSGSHIHVSELCNDRRTSVHH